MENPVKLLVTEHGLGPEGNEDKPGKGDGYIYSCLSSAKMGIDELKRYYRNRDPHKDASFRVIQDGNMVHSDETVLQ